MHHISRTVFGVSAMAIVCSAAASSVEAQTLHLGSFANTNSGSAVVNTAGTQASGTYSFTGGATAATSTYKVIDLFNASTLTLDTGSSVTKIIFNNNDSSVNINGGSVDTLYGYNHSITNIHSGNIHVLAALNDNTINITGGSFDLLSTYENGVVDILGTSLTATYVGIGSGFIGYDLGGTLQNGDVFTTHYANFGGTLKFNGVSIPVPETTSAVSLGLMLSLGLGGFLAVRKRKSTPAA